MQQVHKQSHAAVLASLATEDQAFFRSTGGRDFAMDTTNALLLQFDGALGIKTGYTPGAGRCLIALAERDGHEVLAILLHAPDRWWDTVALLELAKEGLIDVTQAEAFAPIYVRLAYTPA